MSRFSFFARTFTAAILVFGAISLLTAQNKSKPKSGLNKVEQAVAEKAENAGEIVKLSEKSAPTEAEIRKSLLKPVDANLNKAPLNKVLESITQTTGTNIWLDAQAFLEEGVEPGELVSHQGKPIAASRFLDRILPPLGLTWIIEDDVVQVTTIIAAEEKLYTRNYPVGDLIEYAESHQGGGLAQNVGNQLHFVQFGGGEGGGGAGGFAVGGGGLGGGGAGLGVVPAKSIPPSPGAWLINLLQSMTSGPWVDIDGTGGSISYLNNNLVVRQTQKVQLQCEKLIDTIREFTKGELEPNPVAIRPPHYSIEEDQQIKKALAKPISVKGKELPLNQLMDALGERLAIPVHFDVQALNEEGVAVAEPVTIALENLPADSLLKRVLQPMGLSAIIVDGRLVVTTNIASEEILVTEVYDVRDLEQAELSGPNLVSVVQQETSGPWIDIDGTGGKADEPLDGLLVVRQTQKVHKQIAGILADFRKEIAESPNAVAKQEPADPKEVTTKFYTTLMVVDLSAVQKAIVTFVEPASWTENDNTAEGKIMLIDRTLAVKNRNEVHAKLQEFLDDLNKAIQKGQGGNLGLQGGGNFGGGGVGAGGVGAGAGFFQVPAKPVPAKPET